MKLGCVEIKKKKGGGGSDLVFSNGWRGLGEGEKADLCIGKRGGYDEAGEN